MFNIEIDLVELTQEQAKEQRIAACYYINNEEMTENDRLARHILAPLAVRQLFIEKGNKTQQINAGKLGQVFADSSAACGGAVWFCGDAEELQQLTLADGFRPYSFGQVSKNGCFILILENNEERERAYLVRPNW